MGNLSKPSINSFTSFLFLVKEVKEVQLKFSVLTGINVNPTSIPLFSISPIFVKNEEYPVDVGTFTLEIRSVVVFWYQVKSTINRLLKNSRSAPISNSSVFSGTRLGFPKVVGTKTTGCPAYTSP